MSQKNLILYTPYIKLYGMLVSEQFFFCYFGCTFKTEPGPHIGIFFYLAMASLCLIRTQNTCDIPTRVTVQIFSITYSIVLSNCIAGPRYTAILLNGWILPFGGASAVEGFQSVGLLRLSSILDTIINRPGVSGAVL